jgi:hypothetical protein
MKAQWFAIVAAAASVTACGAAATGGTLSPATATPEPASAAPSATPTPTPPPPPPLAIIQRNGAVSAVDGTGHVQWSLTSAAVNGLLSATSKDNVTIRTAGPNVFLSRIPSMTLGTGFLVVLDRTGKQIGSGSFTPNSFSDDVYGDPTGTEWAWSVEDSPLGAQPAHGRIMVAGINSPAHSVFSWVTPTGGFDEEVAGWTDMGIVMERIGFGGCGIGFHGDTASFLIDPVAGTLTNLFTNGDHYGDARHGVRAAFSNQSGSVVTVNGTAYDEPHTVAQGVYVSPDGARVGVQRYAFGGCAGGPPEPSLKTEIIDVAGGTHTDVAGCGISAWFDATDFACSALGDKTVKLDGLDGHTVATLGTGTFIGALTSA